MKTEANEIRCLASELILKLYDSREKEQLELLKMMIAAALRRFPRKAEKTNELGRQNSKALARKSEVTTRFPAED